MIIIGIILIVSGFAIRLIAIKQLKGDFSLLIKQPASICRQGMYKYIRHPSYVGSMLVITGASIICVEVAVVMVAFLFFLARSINEEQLLTHYCPEYTEYQQTTGMFIPRIFRKNGVNK